MNPDSGRGFFMQKKYILSLFLLACVTSALVYSVGLPGGFMFDDYPNLEAVNRFTEGKLDAGAVVFNNASGAFGRAIPMTTFVANAATTGMNAGPMKITNIFIHLCCGAFVAMLCGLLIGREKTLRARAPMYGCALAAIWLVLPINLSTVLFIIQRMTQLSALFVLIGLIAYVVARTNWQTRQKRSLFLLWTIVPACTLLAMLSKENGALLPLFALVIEGTLLKSNNTSHERRHLYVFYGIFLILPAIAGFVLLCLGHGVGRLDYSGRDFTLSQRLFTEPSVLWSYIHDILLPFGSGLGLTHDDYPISSTLFSPRPLFAFAAWIAAIYSAWRLHAKGYRLVLAGLLFFLAGHTMESTIFPLEIYFEHRNYVPGVGILLATFGVVDLLLRQVKTPSVSFRRCLSFSALLLFASYAAATAVRAAVWQDMDTLMRASILAHPNSARLNFQFAGLLLDEHDYDRALVHMDRAASLMKDDASAILLAKVSVYCLQGSEVPRSLVEQLVQSPPQRFRIPGDIAYESVTKLAGAEKCRSFSSADAAVIGAAWIKGDTNKQAFSTGWRFQHYVALNFSHAKEWGKAIPYSETAWKLSGHQLQTGLLLFQLYDAVGNKPACAKLLQELIKYDNGSDKEMHEAVESFSAYMQSAAPAP
jgi:hypothetical protein